jgi:hypothetical protein
VNVMEKRVIDRERQWRKVDAGHYTSPRARFEAVREDDGTWLLVDSDGEHAPEWFDRWRDARAHVEAIEFADDFPIQIVEDEIRDEHRHVVILQLVRGAKRLGDIVVRDGEIQMPVLPDPIPVDVAEAFATALMLATHRAAAIHPKEVQ